jgi:hypothetical protein
MRVLLNHQILQNIEESHVAAERVFMETTTANFDNVWRTGNEIETMAMIEHLKLAMNELVEAYTAAIRITRATDTGEGNHV